MTEETRVLLPNETVKTAVSVGVKGMGRWFAGLPSNLQADFLQGAAEASDYFPRPASFQWSYLGEMLGDPVYRKARLMVHEWDEYAASAGEKPND